MDVVLFRFAGLPLGFPYLFPLGRLVSSSTLLWGCLALVLCALARLIFPLTLLFSALLGRRQSLVFARRKNTFCDLPRVRARHAPARSVVLNNCFYFFTQCIQLLEIE